MVADDASTKWVYRYDEQGNRIGLIEVPDEDTSNDDMAYGEFYTWYVKLEKAVIIHEMWSHYKTVISTVDQMVLNLELEALRYSEKNGFQPSITRKEIIDVYWTESGDKKHTKITINKQNVRWIYNYIRRRMQSMRMRFYDRDISDTLHHVSNAYMASEMNRVPVIVLVSESLAHRIRKIA